MLEIEVKDWKDYQQKVDDLSRERVEPAHGETLSRSSTLFRGHGDSKWRLETTLERYINADLAVAEYHRRVRQAQPKIESFTNRCWTVPLLQNLNDLRDAQALTVDFVLTSDEHQVYEYYSHLRHHGFPSPLLDWTRSPYIAAYFAFRNVEPTVKEVAVYSFKEFAGVGKTFSRQQPFINGLGPAVRTHKRHFLQQSEYTICTVKRDSGWDYASHEDAFEDPVPGQDLLRKLLLPADQRLNFLKELSRFNITAHSLFDTEESLLETIALDEFYLEDLKSR